MAKDHTLIRVGKSKIGIMGLEQAHEEVSKSFDGQSPQIIKEELLKRLKVRNFIPEPAKESYMEAFWREYQRFMGIEVKEESEGLEIKILGRGVPTASGWNRRLLKYLAI